ncbi:hypothetical protein Lal_00002205 [Lupinus albus]|nr:hypothetical protein Lal_00002205 [Lupinus albus]
MDHCYGSRTTTMLKFKPKSQHHIGHFFGFLPRRILMLENLELLGKMLHHLDKEYVDGYWSKYTRTQPTPLNITGFGVR